MKKSIHLLAAAVMTVMSVGAHANTQNNSEWNYYWDKNKAPERGLTPYTQKSEWKNEGRTSYFGMEGAYSINQRNGRIDLSGGYLTYAAYDNVGPDRTHQFLFMAGLLKGTKTYATGSGWGDKHSEREIPLIAGYNYNLAVHDRILLYAGFRGGMVFGSHKITGEGFRRSSTDSAALFGGGCGVKFIVTPRMDITVGYEYQRNFTRYYGENYFNGYHTLKAGVSFGF